MGNWGGGGGLCYSGNWEVQNVIIQQINNVDVLHNDVINMDEPYITHMTAMTKDGK